MALTDAQRDDAREAFNLFDRTSSGFLNASEVVTVLRSLGYQATADVEKEADPESTGIAKLQDVLRCVESAASRAQASNKVAEKQLPWIAKGASFFFDKKTGRSSSNEIKDDDLISIESLKRILTKTGEKMSDEEAHDLFRELQVFDGNKVKYKDFADLLTTV